MDIDIWKFVDDEKLWDFVWDELIGMCGNDKQPYNPNYVIKRVNKDGKLRVEIEFDIM